MLLETVTSFLTHVVREKKTIWFYINVFLYSYIVYILYAYMDILLYNITYNTRKRVWVFWIKCLGYIIYKRDAFRKIILLPPLPEELLKGNQFFFFAVTASPYSSPLFAFGDCVWVYTCIYMYKYIQMRVGEWQPLCRLATMSRACGINKRKSFGNVIFRIKRRHRRMQERWVTKRESEWGMKKREFTRAERRLMNNIKFCARPTQAGIRRTHK